MRRREGMGRRGKWGVGIGCGDTCFPPSAPKLGTPPVLERWSDGGLRGEEEGREGRGCGGRGR